MLFGIDFANIQVEKADNEKRKNCTNNLAGNCHLRLETWISVDLTAYVILISRTIY